MLNGFGQMMIWVLTGVDLFTTGLVTIINWLTPFADVIGLVTGAWAAFNVVLAFSPLTWIVLGIMAIVTAIGFVMKYTSGWGDNFKVTTHAMKLAISSLGLFIKANFLAVVNGIMIALEMIKRGWYRFKESVGMGVSSENQEMIKQINDSIERRKKAIVDGYKKAAQTGKEAAKAFGITIDTEAIKKDFKALKDKFNGFGKKSSDSSVYDDYLKKRKGKGKIGDKGKVPGSTIVSGGKKMTHINVTIHKLQDDTKIYVQNAEKGIQNMGEKVQEQLLRSINSINQMQTSK
jgi:hypothetical protein